MKPYRFDHPSPFVVGMVPKTVVAFLLAFAPALAGGGGGSGGASAGAAATALSGGGSSGSAPATSVASPSGTAGYQNLSTLITPKVKTLYVLVYGPDPATTNYVAYEVSLKLSNRVSCIDQGLPQNCNPQKTSMTKLDQEKPIWVLPEPAWTLADFTAQCLSDPEKTAGALILYDIENDSGSFSYVLFQNVYDHLYAKAIIVSCELRTADKVPKSDFLSYSSTIVTTPGTRTDEDATKAVVTPAPHNTAYPSTTTNYPAAKLRTDTKTIQSIPTMQIVWQNSDNLSAGGGQGAVPFVGLASLGAYLAQRFTKSTTTTVSTPSQVTSGASTQVATQTNTSDLPFAFALVAASVGTLSSSNLGGTNPTRILKQAAAGLATRLVNLIADDCHDDNECKELGAIFNLDIFQAVSKVQRAHP